MLYIAVIYSCYIYILQNSWKIMKTCFLDATCKLTSSLLLSSQQHNTSILASQRFNSTITPVRWSVNSKLRLYFSYLRVHGPGLHFQTMLYPFFHD